MTNSLHVIKDIAIYSNKHDKPILVDARYPESKKSLPVLIFSHGFKGFKDWGHWNLIANRMASAGFCVVKFNFSHNGTTPDKPVDFADLEAFSNNTLSLETHDLGKVIDYVDSEECIIPNLSKQVFLIGHSRGGGITILKAATDDRIKGLVTWASVADFESRWPKETLKQWEKDQVIYIPNSRTGQQMPMKYHMVEDFYANKDQLFIRDAAEKLNIPYLIIHGTNDPTVAVKDAQLLHEWAKNSTLEIIEEADHVFNGKHPFEEKELPPKSLELVDKTLSFLRKLVD